MEDSLERTIEERVTDLGFEFVELERAGSRSRPILRVRIDRPNAGPGHGVTLEDCARVSRALEEFLDAAPDLAERYVLEVSSPGIERPLKRNEDFQRFAGRDIAVLGHEPIAGNSRRLEGTLEGLAGEAPDERIVVRTAKGVVEVPRNRVTRVHLLFRWPADDG